MPPDLIFTTTASYWHPSTLAMLILADLKAARDAWLEQAPTDQDRKEREKSDFLQYRDSEGRAADFHALRHTYITNLTRGNVSPRTAQALARHSTITLTMEAQDQKSRPTTD